jgi:hypothetical protein
VTFLKGSHFLREESQMARPGPILDNWSTGRSSEGFEQETIGKIGNLKIRIDLQDNNRMTLN